ncbi:MAG: hypothetical protein ACYTDT_13555, partial [Planctomycetota bacterium]
MRILFACALLAVVSITTVQGDVEFPIKKNEAKAELIWELDKKTYYKWDVTSWENKNDAEKKPTSAVYVHFMGYELDATGTVRRVHQPYEYYELAFQFAAYMPNKKKKEGDTWEKSWEMDHNTIGAAVFKST